MDTNLREVEIQLATAKVLGFKINIVLDIMGKFRT